MNDKTFHVKAFETARELIDFVSPINDFWKGGSYIFRGQPRQEYKLTPSICRRGPGSFAHGSAHRSSLKSTIDQVVFEFDVLTNFLAGCDKSGLVVPGYSEEIKRRIHKSANELINPATSWPIESLYEIMAVAQHYDVPTRLLDWTTRSFVACYFAASSAEFKFDCEERVAIWALDISSSRYWRTVQIIDTPGGTSKNQAAQSGLFTTHVINGLSLSDTYMPESLENIPEIYETARSEHPLVKITLPLEEAPRLLELCSAFGVDGSTLFPGYHGAAKMVKDWGNSLVGVHPSRGFLDEMAERNYQD